MYKRQTDLVFINKYLMSNSTGNNNYLLIIHFPIKKHLFSMTLNIF